MSYDNKCKITYMSMESQENVRIIEQALLELRRGQSRHRGQHRMDRERSRGRHDRSLGAAARFRMLEALSSADGPIGVSELAQAIGVDQPRASRLVADATEHGLVRREVDPKDARRSSIELTEAGRDTLESAHRNRRAAVTTALAEFTPKETATFAALLSRFVNSWPRH